MKQILRASLILTTLIIFGCTPKFKEGDKVLYKYMTSDTSPEHTATGTVVRVMSEEVRGKTMHFYRVDMGKNTAHITDEENLPVLREKDLKRIKQ